MDDDVGFSSKLKTGIFRHKKRTVDGIVYHVYSGICDGIPTKWITMNPWDGTIVFQHGMYKDGNGAEMFVYESDETEYAEW